MPDDTINDEAEDLDFEHPLLTTTGQQDHQRYIIYAVLGVVGGLVAVLGVVGIFAWVGVRATEADRGYRTERVQVCETIENEATRAACVMTGGK